MEKEAAKRRERGSCGGQGRATVSVAVRASRTWVNMVEVRDGARGSKGDAIDVEADFLHR